MDWDVIDVKIVGDRILKVRFKDGIEGVVEFQPTFFRGVFSVLSDISEFERVSVNDGVVTWPRELDLAPDAMHQEIKAYGKWVLD